MSRRLGTDREVRADRRSILERSDGFDLSNPRLRRGKACVRTTIGNIFGLSSNKAIETHGNTGEALRLATKCVQARSVQSGSLRATASEDVHGIAG